MGKGGQGIAPEEDIRSICWDEVKQHQKKGDSWIVIDGYVYDTSKFAKRHPGGNVITHWAGQDATEAYRAFHTNFSRVHKYMATIRIGRLEASDITSADDEVKKDFEELREKAKQLGYFKPSIPFFLVTVGQLIFFELIGLFIICYYGTGWLPWTLSVFLLAAGQAQAGWSQHDFGHLSVFKSVPLNHAMHWFTMCFMKGASCDWWNHLHNQHHSKPNVINKDPDVRLEALFVVGEEMPKRMAKKKKTMPYNWQQGYFFAIGPPLLFPIFFQIMTIRHAIVRRKWIDVFFMALFYLRFAIIYSSLMGVWGMCKFYFAMRIIESHWFVWVSQSNHIPMEIDDDKERPWLPLQLRASCNIEGSYFNNWFTGHLNYQIEHHLFPTMPRHNLYKVTPLVRELCKKYNIEFQNKPILTAFFDIVRSLKHSGEIWYSYYHTYHKL
ncbi:hypothetical protein NP493_150g00034 [Ridgeia piscesae]|uniref:Cytochrome b5 heme-binding domain-containing protein n=1 Tax=Ridgeia piscesae TaxID=27915 RepID=A0AAD9UFZ2_RIDPI|nr:hypothetical protein NP493_150g00034 [Ridgeia piscesae]